MAHPELDGNLGVGGGMLNPTHKFGKIRGEADKKDFHRLANGVVPIE
jgi:hypothetical protein